jgi:hypothetical protein
VFYHPEAVVVLARPAETLAPLLHAAQHATRIARLRGGVLVHEPWTPHLTIACSSAVQPAAPVIAALGWELPACRVTIRKVSLVNQDGPEYSWNWRLIADVPLGPTVARGGPC